MWEKGWYRGVGFGSLLVAVGVLLLVPASASALAHSFKGTFGSVSQPSFTEA